jgi:hypothetical protein
MEMNDSATHPEVRSRWIDWQPKDQMMANEAGAEPTKPSKPGFVGFDGSLPGESAEIEVPRTALELAHASAVLQRAGVRIMDISGVVTVGLWSDLDGPDVRSALSVLGSSGLPVRYLDSSGIPMRYKLRRVEGEPVPLSVLRAMESCPTDPWAIRDQMLMELKWNPTSPAASARRGRRPADYRRNSGSR